MRSSSLLGVVALLGAAAPLAHRPGTPVGPAWREDLRLIAAEMPRRHPDLFYRLSRSSWDSAVRSLDRRLPGLTRNQAVAAFMELVALPRDGHTALNPLFDGAFGWRYYPVQYEWFEDGLFVRQAGPGLPGLAGARVIRIGKVSVEDALSAVARTIPHENDWWVRAWAPPRLAMPELLDGLGLVADMEALPIVVERGGRRDTVVLHPAGRLTPRGHGPGSGIDMTGWTDMRTGSEVPLRERQPERPYWMEYQPATRLLYVSYRGVVDVPPPGNTQFWRAVFALADSVPVEKLILDLRQNTGGNSFYNRQVIRGIVARPALDRPDRLYVLIGGRTFSAAMNLTLDLEQWTNATFVGEPTGNATVFFGDHVPVALPKSGLTLNISSLPWYPSDPRDHREFKAPALFTPFTSADYAAGRDPALDAILTPGSVTTVADLVAPLVASGDTAAMLPALTTLHDRPINRFRSIEAEVNALGYALQRQGKRAEAMAVFRANTRLYPESANAWDSLGEALAGTGNAPDAIIAYRKALALDSTFASSRTALQRLGAR